MRARIAARLAAIEEDRTIAVMLAVESGSRAWGFPSRDSDYDIRFIYARPVADYLAVSQKRDVIEFPLDENGWDIGGWDLHKALTLALRSNATIGEWLTSPIVYRAVPDAVSAMADFLQDQFSTRRYALHYFHIAERYWRERAAGRPHVADKTYCYVLRSLLAMLWTAGRRDFVPMNVDELLTGVEIPAAVADSFAAIRLRKMTSPETVTAGRESASDRWIEDLLNRMKPVCYALPDREPDWRAGDKLFRRILESLWGIRT